jgi:hypothetical protein
MRPLKKRKAVPHRRIPPHAIPGSLIDRSRAGKGQELITARGRTHHHADVHRTVSSIPNRTDMSSRIWARPAVSFSTTVSF